MGPKYAAYVLWLVFLVTWYIAALWTSRTAVRAPFRTRLAYYAGFVLGFELLFQPPAGAALYGRPILTVGAAWPASGTMLWSDSAPVAWALLGVEAAAFGFAWWARVHMGRLWSGMMSLREDHRVVDTGPFRLVRHPIYTGFITAAWALALQAATPSALAGAMVLTVVMSVKAKSEEAFLRRELGEASYDAYAARTPMIVPFGPR
ncbi:MAG TPA: isoprenylcysteine carboxylmethyltransferase family protein [Caulobacteraceae bacterium]|jgi:protein-S-isoprenylcysteine O-methyltransferase Ste14